MKSGLIFTHGHTGKSLSEALIFEENMLCKYINCSEKSISVHNKFSPCFQLGILWIDVAPSRQKLGIISEHKHNYSKLIMDNAMYKNYRKINKGKNKNVL